MVLLGLWALFLLLAFLPDKIVSMPCNHQIFISTHHPHNAWTAKQFRGLAGSVRACSRHLPSASFISKRLPVNPIRSILPDSTSLSAGPTWCRASFTSVKLGSRSNKAACIISLPPGPGFLCLYGLHHRQHCREPRLLKRSFHENP